MGDVFLLQELGEMQEPAHPARVRTAVDLEKELFPAGCCEQVRVMRAPARPRLDANSGERAARDLVGRLSALVLRGRDGERAHGRDESSREGPYAQRVNASCAAT